MGVYTYQKSLPACARASLGCIVMAKKEDKKAAPKKAAGSGGGKAKKKKWSKGKVKEKLANLVLFDKTTYEKMMADVPKLKLITPSIISEKLKVDGSLARKAVKELVKQNLIRPILTHKHQNVYTRATNQ